jgi:hypothetical protein
MQPDVAQPAKETVMNTYSNNRVTPGPVRFGRAFEFVVERLVLGSIAALIVYGGYRIFLL